MVFSIVDDEDVVIPKQVECNNCGIVHHVEEIGKSKILPSELVGTQVTQDDIEASIPTNIATILKSYEMPLPFWEEVQFLLEQQKAGFVVLKKSSLKIDQNEDDSTSGKILRIFPNGTVKVESFTRNNYLELK